ncbi:antibiotic ABC transporter permease [Clostridia bacterium]|nr:antibiotic ABC transporter permease [Clostridia bacterium]
MTAAFRHARKYVLIARVSLSDAMAYRARILSRFCFYTLFIYVFMRLWGSIYEVDAIPGFTRVQMVWYLIMTELVQFVGNTGIFGAMNDEVKSGAIAYQIGRPIHYVFYQLANAAGKMLLNLVGFGALALVLGLVFVGPLTTFKLIYLPPLLLSLVISFLLNFFFQMALGLTAFVIEENSSVYMVYQKITFILGMFFPIEFLPVWLQNIAKNLPFSYICWAPAKLFVSFSAETFWYLVPRQLLWLAVSLAAVLLAYRACVKRLQLNGG